MTDYLSPDEQARFDSLYGATQTAAEPSGPGAIAGAYKGLAGIPSGLAGAPLSIASAATGAADNKDYAELFSAVPAVGLLGSIHQPIEQARQDAAEFYRPDPQTTGFVGNTLFGATDVITRIGVGNLLAPGAGLTIAAGTTGFERTKDLEAQGVDPATAQLSGVLTGGSLLAMGGVANSFGKTLATRMITGAGSNVAFGGITRGADSALLNANGYTAQAEQQKWNDGAAVMADLIIGGAFGALPHGAKPEGGRVPADVVDSALTAKSAQNVTDLAPGVPADPRSASAHVDALDTAQAQLMDGQDVTVDPVVRDATFVPREAEAVEGLHEALTDSGIPAESLAVPESRDAAGTALRQRLESDPERVFAEYAALPDSDGGRILNTDTARELSPEYLADRTRSADVHEPASDTVKQLYAKKLAEPTPEGFDRSVTFTAGGTGAGKSTAIKALEGIERPPEIIYDTNMNTLDSAVKKVDQALAAGRDVQILYVYRDPVEALTGGALPRAERQAKEFGTGRTVPLSEHARTHAGVRSVMEALAEKYRHDPRVDIRAYDNSRGKDNGAFADLADIPKVDQNGLHERLQAALQQEHQAGRISDATRAGFDVAGRNPEAVQRPAVQGARRESPEEHPAGRSQPRLSGASDAADTQAAAGTDGAPADAGLPQQGPAGADAKAEQRTGLDPARIGEVERARVAAATHSDAVLADGTTVADALRAADNDVHQAETQGEAIQAAVACFLRFGAEA